MYDCQHTDQNNSKSDHAFRSNGCLMQWGSSFFSSHHRQRNYGLKLTSWGKGTTIPPTPTPLMLN
jgi:hypothetical protein